MAAGSVPSRREPTPKRMYGCIEEIGPELAATLYEAYPSVSDPLEANKAELTRLEGIGEARAAAIYAAFRDAGSGG